MKRITVDVRDLKAGDIIVEAEDLGPVKSHRQHASGPDIEVVYWECGMRDIFGAPQKLDVLRG